MEVSTVGLLSFVKIEFKWDIPVGINNSKIHMKSAMIKSWVIPITDWHTDDQNHYLLQLLFIRYEDLS